jgi:hypothetical protein
MTKENISKAPESRPKRIPIGTRNRLEVVGKDPNFQYRIVNDNGARVQQFKDAGYEVVDPKEAYVALTRVDQSHPDGGASISVGGAQTAYLMKIPKELWEEDQANKQKIVKERETAITKPNFDGAYGDIKVN